MRRSITGFILALLGVFGAGDLLPASSAQELRARELSAPPEDVLAGHVRLGASPLSVSDHALLPISALPIRANEGAAGLSCTQRFEHGGNANGSPLSIAVAMAQAWPNRGSWQIALRDSDGTLVYRSGGERANQVVERVGDLAPILHLSEPLETLRLDLPEARPGQWTVEIVNAEGRGAVPGMIVVSSPGANELRGRFESRIARVGVPRSFLLSGDADIGVADATVIGPSRLPLATVVADARNGPTVSFVPVEPGPHTLRVSGRAQGRDGTWASRTIETTFNVSGSTLRFAAPNGRERSADVMRSELDPMRERLQLRVDGGADGEAVVVAAEAWLVDGGRAEPIAWLANIATVERRGADAPSTLSLTFDRRWLGRAISQGPNRSSPAGRQGARLELRSLRLQSRDGATLIDTLDVLDAGPAPAPAAFDPRDESSLLTGRAGGHPVGASVALGAVSDAAPGSHALMLVHGYCSDGAPFPTSHFTGAVAQFLDPNAARSNDEFAQLIAGFGANYKSYGTVCHSQGGLASLHLYTFYWSGLDWATGPRLIQSVGSPYQGTPLAGNLAVLGSIFGVGCGPVADMSPEGASAWLATIPTWARAKVWYWTTSYKDLPLSYDYCDFVSDLFLSNPDDGVIEKSKGQLPGATNMGHAEGWCHTTDMEDPPQCTDATRNAQMNAQAAR